MKKIQSNIQWILIIGLIIVLNLLLSSTFVRIDLTSEKRYSLSKLTKETVKKLHPPSNHYCLPRRGFSSKCSGISRSYSDYLAGNETVRG